MLVGVAMVPCLTLHGGVVVDCQFSIVMPRKEAEPSSSLRVVDYVALAGLNQACQTRLFQGGVRPDDAADNSQSESALVSAHMKPVMCSHVCACSPLRACVHACVRAQLNS